MIASTPASASRSVPGKARSASISRRCRTSAASSRISARNSRASDRVGSRRIVPGELKPAAFSAVASSDPRRHRARAAAARTSPPYTVGALVPEASIASGSSDVSVSPGITFASRNHGVPVVVDDEVDAGEVAESERAVREHRGIRHRRGHRRRRAATARRTSSPRRCSAPGSRRRPRSARSRPAGSATGPSPVSIDADRDLGADDALLDHGDVAVGERLDHRAGQVVRCRRRWSRPGPIRRSRASRRGRPRAPSRRPASTLAAPSSRNASCDSTIDSGTASPARATSELADGFDHARRAAAPVRADVGDAEARAAGRAVSRPRRSTPCRAGQTTSGRSLARNGSSAGIGIAQHDPVPGRDQCVGDASAGAQRDVALVGDAARQDDDVETVGIAHDQGFLHYLRSDGGAES